MARPRLTFACELDPDRLTALFGDGSVLKHPIMADERRARSTLLQRLLVIVDVTADRDVWMLYTSFMRTIGPGMVWTYGYEASAGTSPTSR